jgi:hypothetical protein
MSNEDMRYVLIRSDKAGVFAGNIESKDGAEVVLRNSRRIWYWAGAASLSQLAVDGTSEPEQCKFPVAIDKIQILGVIEIIDVTKKAEESIKSVKIWSC